MKKMRWQILLGIGLVALSTLIYLIHYVFFHDTHHIFMFLVGDIAFVPIEVLLVTLIIHRLLAYREKRSLIRKLNMVIGTFFSEVGTGLLKKLRNFDPSYGDDSSLLTIDETWGEKAFVQAAEQVLKTHHSLDAGQGDLRDVYEFLVERRDFLLRLLGNPNLMEHEAFTDLLWAVFHLTEELMMRSDFETVAPADAQHLSGDMDRAYRLLIAQWLVYLNHLRVDYPYLYSLALRTNPFNSEASVAFK